MRLSKCVNIHLSVSGKLSQSLCTKLVNVCSIKLRSGRTRLCTTRIIEKIQFPNMIMEFSRNNYFIHALRNLKKKYEIQKCSKKSFTSYFRLYDMLLNIRKRNTEKIYELAIMYIYTQFSNSFIYVILSRIVIYK